MSYYKMPKVTCIQQGNLAVGEIAGRVCYDSFSSSEHASIRAYENGCVTPKINSSELLDKLAHVYFHGSVLEHIPVSYFVTGLSRGVLQELARHRIGVSLSVRSTRYVMGFLIQRLLIATYGTYLRMGKPDNIHKEGLLPEFIDTATLQLTSLMGDSINEVFCCEDKYMNGNVKSMIAMFVDRMFVDHMDYDVDESIDKRTDHSENVFKDICDRMFKMTTLDVDIDMLGKDFPRMAFKMLTNPKTVRNIGDDYKYLVTDNWVTNQVITMNARSLSSFLKLRNSGAAYAPMRDLAIKISEATPKEILDLCIPKKKRR